MTASSDRKSQIANRKSQLLAWQGFSLRVPTDWNPAGLTGDHVAGTLLLADLHGPRLGLRWETPGRRETPAAAVLRSLQREVGRLAAAEAVVPASPTPGHWPASLLYVDPDPPGRDVWAGVSRVGGRLLTVVYHAQRRDDGLAHNLLPTLDETPADAPWPWAVFDLRFTTPAGWGVRSTRLLAGDLAVLLTPRGRARPAVVLRQIAPASLALTRRPLDAWLTGLPFTPPRLYRPLGQPRPLESTFEAESLSGLLQTLYRRRRFAWAWFVPPRQVVMALHDAGRDRLLIAQGEPDATEAVLRSALP